MNKFRNLGFFIFLIVLSGLVIGAITPTSPTTSDNLNSGWTYNATENLKWYKNNVANISLENSTYVASGNTTKGEVWYYELYYDNSTLKETSGNVTIQNTAPVITAIADQEAQEDVEWTYQVSASDVDGDTLTYSLTTYPTTDMIINSTGAISGWTPSSAGEETVTVNVTDGTDTDSETFDVLVGPDLCGDGTCGQIEISKFDIEDEDDDFYPGDIVVVEVEVDNEYSSSDEDGDVEDIVIEVILYDLTDGDELDSIESDAFDLDAGEDENDLDDFELEIPADVDSDHEIRVYVLVYEDGNKDTNCEFESQEIDVERRKHDVDVDKFTLTPSTANPGDTISAKIEVEKIGDRDEDDVYVKLTNTALGVSQTSNEFDLDRYGKSDSDHKLTFTFTVPDDVNAGTYSIEVSVYDESGDVYESGNEFKDLVISSSGTGTTDIPTDTVITSLAILSFDSNINEGGSVSIPVTITNDGSSTAQYSIEVTNIDDWADPVSSKTVNVGAGQSITEYMYLKTKTGVSGKHSATVNVKSGNEVVATQTVLVDIVGEAEQEGEGFFSKIGELLSNKTFLWVAGDIVLILVAIWFIKMLFTRKH